MALDLKISRVCLIQDFSGAPGPCPRCGSELEQEHQTYLVATTRGSEMMDSFIMGADFGWYCDNCPTVVVNARKVNEMLSTAMARWDVGNQWAVVGIVDLGAVPPNKRHLPLGDDDNPVPLVQFEYPESKAKSTKSPAPLTKPRAGKKPRPL